MAFRLIALAAASSLAAGAVYAADVGDFASLDADKSGGLSVTEVQAAAPDATAEDFATADADASGELSADEFAAWKASKA